MGNLIRYTYWIIKFSFAPIEAKIQLFKSYCYLFMDVLFGVIHSKKEKKRKYFSLFKLKTFDITMSTYLKLKFSINYSD